MSLENPLGEDPGSDVRFFPAQVYIHHPRRNTFGNSNNSTCHAVTIRLQVLVELVGRLLKPLQADYVDV